ncbi:MAG: outer membrane lipoprotein carrier protein LolA [Gemmatimonadota bacterium]|nr:outer membrane lipoprotein carrier protein LolA [Gemmatimonadota bacterium]
MNKLVVTVFLLCFACPSVPARSAPPAESTSGSAFRQVLDGIDSWFGKLQSFEARFTQVVEVPALEKSEKYRGCLYFRQPELLRLEYIEPEGQLLVADGRWYWFFMPGTDIMQAMRSPMKPQSEGNIPSAPGYILGGNMSERFTGKLLGEQVRLGKPCYVLELFPLESNIYYRTLKAWVDKSTYATRAVCYTDDGGSLNTFDLFGHKENIPIEPEKFIFVPPPGTQILDSWE